MGCIPKRDVTNQAGTLESVDGFLYSNGDFSCAGMGGLPAMAMQERSCDVHLSIPMLPFYDIMLPLALNFHLSHV